MVPSWKQFATSSHYSGPTSHSTLRLIIMGHGTAVEWFCFYEFEVDPVADVLEQLQAGSNDHRLDVELVFVDQAEVAELDDHARAATRMFLPDCRLRAVMSSLIISLFSSVFRQSTSGSVRE